MLDLNLLRAYTLPTLRFIKSEFGYTEVRSCRSSEYLFEKVPGQRAGTGMTISPRVASPMGDSFVDGANGK